MTMIDRVTEVLYSVPPRQRMSLRWRLAPDVLRSLMVETGGDPDHSAREGDQLLGYPIAIDDTLAPGAIEWDSDEWSIPMPVGYTPPPCVACGAAWDAPHGDGCPVVTEPVDDSLDAAWAEVMAALPDGWVGPHIAPELATRLGLWRAFVWERPVPMARLISAHGPTPAAALRALTAKLRERPT